MLNKKQERKNKEADYPQETPIDEYEEERASKAKRKQEKKDKKKNSNYTLSIVIPSSVVDNAQSKELRTYLVGQLARTAGIFKVDEIIIFHDVLNKKLDRDYINFFVTNLQYLETPQYLRRTLFPKSDDLILSGLMNPLDSSHHVRIDEWCPYREGVVLNRPVKKDEGSWVNIGLTKDCKINTMLEEKTRVTVKLNEKKFDQRLKYYTGEAVSMNEPKESGLYWGYVVRVAETFKEIFDNSYFEGGYDFVVGTSDKGENYQTADFSEYKKFNHCLMFFGGLQGIEGMLESDEHFKSNDAKSIFNVYLNTCMNQGLRTIRTEEAIMISLAVVKPKLDEIKK